MEPFELSNAKKTLLDTSGHLVVLGGPGSGKTTIALLKAKRIFEAGLKPGQYILFLSFARATVTRVSQQAKNIITQEMRKHLEVNTYHGLAWNILRSYGYLLNSGKKLRLLPPPEAAARLADIDATKRGNEKQKIFREEGLIHFDLFAELTADLLEKSQSVAELLSKRYPIIILDEFQDTDAKEWRFLQQLSKRSTIIALADLEQRIYEFRGADPARVSQFKTLHNPTEFDFGTENNRSNGTDIVMFGNDLLGGVNKGKAYNDVAVKFYPNARAEVIHMPFKSEVLAAYKRVSNGNNPDWSIAVLVPSKRFMLNVSDFLGSKQRYGTSVIPAIRHDVSFEMEGPSLAAIAIAKLMEKGASVEEIQFTLINNLCEHMRGRNGGDPSKASLKFSTALRGFAATGKISGSTRKHVVTESLSIATSIFNMTFLGDPIADWVAIRDILEKSENESVRQLAFDARYLRLLRKGAILASGLGTLWRSKGSYQGAADLVRRALAQEHFAASTTTWKGIHVMTIHKAKGKEFDEVIIYEGMYNGRIVWNDPRVTKKEIDQSKYALRVAVTRAMKRTTIITPKDDPCPFLY